MPKIRDLLPFGALLLLFCTTSAAQAAPATVDLIVRGDYVVTMDDDDQVISDGAVAIQGDAIVAVGLWADIRKSYSSTTVLPGEGRIVMPGLVNGHTHTSMTLFRGMVDDLDLMTWLNDYVFPMEGRFVTPEFVRIGTQLACWEMIEGGTTAFLDMYFYPEVISEVVVDCGLRAVVAAPHIDFPSPGFKGWNDSFRAAIDYVKAWKGKHPRITPAFAPHAPYTVVPEHIEATAKAAAELDAQISMHIAEAPAESELIFERYETTPVQHVAATGLCEQRVTGAHMIQLDAQDIALVAEKGVGAVHNPTSNMKLGAGVAPVTAMIAAGVNVGLGTDGAASNNDLDLWEEIRLAALVHKLQSSDPEALPAPMALAMATRMGAHAVKLGDSIGQLIPGKQADLIQVDYTQQRHGPLYDVPSHLVYVLDSQDVMTTVVAGTVLMRDREVLTIDGARLREEVSQVRDAIRAALAES
ncbi:MAG: amidohydrolase family protein [Pseudomonadota bacterium]